MRFSLVSSALALALALIVSSVASGEIIYDSTPTSFVQGSLPGPGGQSNSTDQYGDYIRFAGTSRSLDSVVITLNSWAAQSDFNSPNAAGYLHPITVNLYNVNNPGSSPTVGSLIATVTQNVLVPWRSPVVSGLPFNTTFDFSLLGIVLPEEIIFGISFNTQSSGQAPIGIAGPYNSLNYGRTPGVGPTVGTDINPNSIFWDTTAAFGGDDTFKQMNGPQSGTTPTVQFVAADAAAEVPEPASLAVWGLVSMAGAAYGWRKRRTLKANA